MLSSLLPITELINKRFSCRTYRKEPISPDKQASLEAFIQELPSGPFGSNPRFKMVAATEADGKALRGLGTYGFIKNPTAFIIGAMPSALHDLEDFGYLMEAIVLHATGLDLGTCWLGGTFTKSSFAKHMQLPPTETIPAAISLGDFINPTQTRQGFASRKAGSHHRIPWEKLFFSTSLDVPLQREKADRYATPLEMVRIAPSASNKQPWRIIKHHQYWRFYLQRTPGYYEDPIKRMLDLCDLQRLDMGIAMCHFELSARELNLEGNWVVEEQPDRHPDALTEYIASWKSNPQKS